MLSSRNCISVCLFFNSDICSSAMSHAGYPCTHYSGTSYVSFIVLDSAWISSSCPRKVHCVLLTVYGCVLLSDADVVSTCLIGYCIPVSQEKTLNVTSRARMVTTVCFCWEPARRTLSRYLSGICLPVSLSCCISVYLCVCLPLSLFACISVCVFQTKVKV